MLQVLSLWVDCCTYIFVFHVASNSNEVYCCVIIMRLPVSLRPRRLPLSLLVICYLFYCVNNFPLDDSCCVGEQTNDDDAVAGRGNDGGEARKTGAGGLAGRIGQP